MSDLFVTGISGLVGRAVAAELEARRLGATVLLRGSTSDLSGGFRVIAGDLETPQTFAPALKGVRAVLHIAALTGAASEEDFRRVNVEGTRALLAACSEEGIRRFVFVSSIAAGFDDLDRYPYGASKRDAEALVRDSGLDFVIVRPTVVLGPGSPILQRFAQLASLPVSPLPGSGDPRIQPIAAEDLASCLVDLALAEKPSGETIEIGGREVVTLADFLRAIRGARGRRPEAVVRLPLAPIQIGLALAQRLTAGRSPVSPAQLAMFSQDGVAEPHPFVQDRRTSFADLRTMLKRYLAS